MTAMATSATRVTKTYPLALSRDYVRHWGLSEAVRELLQNAIDSDAQFEYSFEGDTLTITSRFVTLSPRTLLMGVTTKHGDAAAIGNFGEGYKLALLVLLREGYAVIVRNGDKVWTPAFQVSPDYDAEIMVIEESEGIEDCNAVEFVIMGLSVEEQQEIRASCLLMQPPMNNVIGVHQGYILPDRPGRLYVGGLFVCAMEKMAYGYDFKPEYLQLERDRQTVNTWQVAYQIAGIWLATEQWELVARLMAEAVHDVEDLKHFNVPKGLADACAKQWIKQHGDAIPVSSQQEANDRQQAATRGQSVRTVFVGESMQRAVQASSLVAGTAIAKAPTLSPRQQVEQWYVDNKKNMPRLAKVAFKRLIDASAKWKLA